MKKKSSSELKIVKTKEPLPTIEVDLDSLPADALGYGDFVEKAFRIFSEKNPHGVATIYTYQDMSSNFQHPAFCVFFGVAGDPDMLNSLYEAFRSVKDVNVRAGDYIDRSLCMLSYHIEESNFWKPDEPGTWYLESTNTNKNSQKTDQDSELLENSDNEIIALDSSVGDVRRYIESELGLPEGSVMLCGPDKIPLRGNAKISTLMKRWSE